MSDSNKKTIIVNPDSLEENGSVSSRTRNKKKNIKSKNIKREVLKTLKNNRTLLGKSDKDIKTTTVKNKNFLDDLKESLNILETVSKNRRQEHNKTMKLKKDRIMLDEREFDNVTNESSSSLPYLKKEPIHGCLKGGNKPTYSQSNKTKKRTNIYFPDKPIQSIETIGNIDIQSKAMYSERQRKLQEMKEKSNDNNIPNLSSSSSPVSFVNTISKQNPVQPEILQKVNETLTSNPKPPTLSHSYNLRERNTKSSNPIIHELKNEVQHELENTIANENKISYFNETNNIVLDQSMTSPRREIKKGEDTLIKNIHKTLKNKKTYELGKKNNQINVLIPNNKTRKAKRTETDKIDDISFYNKKRFLEERGFIKKGSNAPEFVLNELYKNILLSGNVTNTNTEKQLYNYMNKE